MKTHSIAVALCALIFCHALCADVIVGRVVRVTDGDTVTILDADHTQHKIRLAKIDAPEKGQPFGTISKNFLAAMITNGNVRVEFSTRDRYGRIIGTIYAESNPRDEINRAMVANGMAWHYTQYDQSTELDLAEQKARSARLGLWRDDHPVPPWEWRKAKRNGRSKKNNSK